MPNGLRRVPRRYVAKRPGRVVREVVKWELFDTKAYAAAGVATLRFFLNPTAGPINSNMSTSGMLPNPQKFDAYGIAVEIFPDYDQVRATGIEEDWAAEKKKIREGAWLQLNVGVKPYLIQPLVRIPEGLGGAGLTAGADETTGAVNEMLLTHGMQDIKHFYPLFVRLKGEDVPIEIPSQQSFYVDIFWPTIIAINATGRTGLHVLVRVYLIGHMFREVQ